MKTEEQYIKYIKKKDNIQHIKALISLYKQNLMPCISLSTQPPGCQSHLQRSWRLLLRPALAPSPVAGRQLPDGGAGGGPERPARPASHDPRPQPHPPRPRPRLQQAGPPGGAVRTLEHTCYDQKHWRGKTSREFVYLRFQNLSKIMYWTLISEKLSQIIKGASSEGWGTWKATAGSDIANSPGSYFTCTQKDPYGAHTLSPSIHFFEQVNYVCSHLHCLLILVINLMKYTVTRNKIS